MHTLCLPFLWTPRTTHNITASSATPPTLQSASMDDLVVDHQLPSTIIDHQCADRSFAVGEGTLNLAIQTTLVNDLQALLHIASLGHADNATIISHVKNAILLVDWAEHALNDNRWLRIGDETALLLELTSEEIDTKISVLAGLGRCADADDLAGTAL